MTMFWRIAAVWIVAATILAIAIVIERYRDRSHRIRAFVRPGILFLTGVVLSASGPDVRQLVWGAFHGAFFGVVDVEKLLTSRFAYQDALLLFGPLAAGVGTALVCGIRGSLATKTLRTAAILAVLFMAGDFWVKRGGPSRTPETLLIVFTDTMGGGILACVLSVTYWLIGGGRFRDLRRDRRVELTPIDRVLTFGMLLLAVLSLGYFFLVFRPSARVVVAITDWNDIAIAYGAAREASDTVSVFGQPLVPLSFRTQRLRASTISPETTIRLTRRDPARQEPVSWFMARLAKELDLSMAGVALLEHMRVRGVVPDVLGSNIWLEYGSFREGYLSVKHKRFAQIDVATSKESEFVLLVPAGRLVHFGRSPGWFSLPREWITDMEPLAIWSPDATLRFRLWAEGRTALGISASPSDGERALDVAVDGARLSIPALDEAGKDPVRAVVFLGPTTSSIDVVTGISTIAMVRPRFSLAGRGGQRIDRVRIRAPIGDLHVGDEKVHLGERDELFMGDDEGSLSISQNVAAVGRLEIFGSSRTIVVNGVLRNRSAWSAMSAELRSGLIAALVSVVVSLWVARRRAASAS